MTSPSLVSPLARAGEVLVDGSDAVSAVHTITQMCVRALDGLAAGVMVSREQPVPGAAGLEVLAASSHSAVELELYQLQIAEGPCIEAVSGGSEISESGHGGLRRRWPRMARALAAAGIGSVHAVPLRWRGETFGALNVFFSSTEPVSARRRSEAQLFADLAAVAVVHASSRPTHEDVLGVIGTAVERGAVVERAKGVVMHVRGLDGAGAFLLLVEAAGRAGVPLTVLADELLDETAHGRRPAWLEA